jgi:murein DD-endopeptidase MepM/ murein hydrolase activator NlpD
MTEDFWTLIVVPHARARFRKIRIPLRTLRFAMIGGAGLILVTLVLFARFARVSWEASEVEALRRENHALKAEKKAYERQIATLQKAHEQLGGVISKLGVIAGLEQVMPDGKIGGLGGIAKDEATPQTADLKALEDMGQSASFLSTRAQRLERFFEDQKVLLGSTPSIWPVRGYLSGGFGNRIDPFTGQRDFHPGIDISTPLGTKVHAPADGIVVFVGTKGGYGNAIILDHGFGIVTRYAHLDGANVKPGQRMHRGDVIGFVGNTGRSTAPHLHYEVEVRGQAQNPITYILDEYRSFG